MDATKKKMINSLCFFIISLFNLTSIVYNFNEDHFTGKDNKFRQNIILKALMPIS